MPLPPVPACVFTAAIIAPVHVELAPRRREPVTLSRRRGCAGRCGGEVRPGHGGGVVDEKVLEEGACGAGLHKTVFGSGGNVRRGHVTSDVQVLEK